ncbi:LOW QUALITY PROTEIN: photoreceptor cilium actin regulator-like [Xyrauchen texanus]|uniref:LOW QUALITY PROTEIN: photoreceptor cilium actin regulator-like n=1 Tax=Xyrauchen texanus TaxID=154827 RepID=UPI0022424DA7|nr:LOW QUALITY PROTEIN: photoreceptor cilium actin regulator-like [Xyrauchen texanus]
MGCSPSRGNNFNAAQGLLRRGRTLLPVTQESPGESQSDDGGSRGSGGGEKDKDNSTAWNNTSSTLLGRKFSTGEQETAGVASAKLGTQEITINILSKERERQEEKQEACEKKAVKKSKKGLTKLNKKKGKERCCIEEKVDFPDPLVKAHQAAYAYLNPSINTYEDLLEILDHAAQTQISLHPMLAFLVLRYEEINKGLQEIVEEGEKMLKENGQNLAWPCQKNKLSSPSSAKNLTSSISNEPPPDLLQQLLQYTVQRMRQVGQLVCGIDDTALEEAVDYISSISEILEKKLRTKRASECRLMQLLSQIEAASLRKSGPEDSVLFSEDSGIGAEIESLVGSDRRHQHRECSESTGTICATACSPSGFIPVDQASYRGRLLRTISNSSSLNSIDSICTITAKENRDMESLLSSVSLDEGEGEDAEDGRKDEKCKDKWRTQSNPSTPDLRQQPHCLLTKRIENPQNVEMTLKLKDAISGRGKFLPSQSSGVKTKQTESSKGCSHQWTEDIEKSSRRPQTAATRMPKKKITVTKESRSRSADYLRSKSEDPTLIELERTQKELNQRLERMTKVKCEGHTKQDSSKQIQQQPTQAISFVDTNRQRSLNINIFSLNNQRKVSNAKVYLGEQGDVKEEIDEEKKKDKEKKKENGKDKDKKVLKGPVKAAPTPSPPTSPRQSSGFCRGRNSVKKLIDSFSLGVEESKQMTESAKVLGPLKSVRKCGVPIIPGLGTSSTIVFNVNNFVSGRGESQCSERTEDLDIDNLPPPPLEVLMDNSFENIQTKDTEENNTSRGRSTLPKRTAMSQRLRASLQSVSVLPSRGNLHKGSVSMSPARSLHQDTRRLRKGGPHDSSHKIDTENEKAASLYKQARKIIHLRHSSNSPTEKRTVEQDQSNLSSCSSDVEVKQENSTNETESNSASRYQTPATPPVSRTRMLPSTPLLHRSLPSPPVFKSEPTSSTSSSPPVVRKLPTPPSAGQRIMPSTSALQQDHTLTYPFKAPSPPTSPKVLQCTRGNSSEESTSRIFSNARSVFCRDSSSLFEAQSVPTPKPPQAWACTGVLPRPWGEHSRLVSARGPQQLIRRSQSDRRPSLRQPPRAPVLSVAETCGSEPAISNHRLEDGPIREDKPWSEQTELWSAVRSASHPDLCIVGHGLQRE